MMITSKVCALVVVLLASAISPILASSADVGVVGDSRRSLRRYNDPGLVGEISSVSSLLVDPRRDDDDADKNSHQFSPKNMDDQRPGTTPNTMKKNSNSLMIIQQQRRRRRLPGDDYSNLFGDMDVNSLGEGFALGAGFVLLIIVLCLLCCCCSMCCGGGGGGGCLTDLLALFCCYELFCDDQPGCSFIPMDGDMMC